MVTVIFPAAGQGKRMRADRNKVFLQLDGKAILEHTLRRFSECGLIDDIIVVAAPAEVEEMRQLLRDLKGLKPWQVVAGGSERQYSIANGLQALPEEAELVLVHDMARPLIDNATIEAVIKEARRFGAAIAAVREKNTIKVVNAEGVVQSTPDRAGLWAIQTPQGFQRKIILEAYQRAAEEGFLGTDDASLVERLDIPVKVVESSYRNIKVTTPEDILVAEAFLAAAKAEEE